MKNNTPKYLLLISIFSLFLSACGGGSDSAPPSGGGSDTTKPVITITGDNPTNLALNATYIELGATAVDSSGDIPTVSIISSNVDTGATGTYQITYQASDTSGNIATATRIISVIIDTTAPSITIIGSNPINLALNTSYTDLGATAVDSLEGTLTVSTSSSVDTSNYGTYTITYQAYDTSDNITTATRTVHVIDYFNASTTISSDVDSANSVFAIDLDGDGYNDVISASFGDNKIVWHKNDGNGVFSSSTTITTSAIDVRSVFAIDLDGDGDNDVLSASSGDNKIAWYENNGSSGFASAATITTSAAQARSVFAIDLDGDGDNDVLSASSNDNKIAWYENTDGSGTFSSENIISTNTIAAYSVFAIDLDGDGDNDVLSASFVDNKIAWYRNDGSGAFPTSTTISTNANGARSVFAIDLDGDGDNDVISACYNDMNSPSAEGNDNIIWYENTDGSGDFSSGTTINNITNANEVVFAIDLDGDSDNDVISAGNGLVLWYENNGNATFSSATIVRDSAGGGISVFAIDLDADGDNDVLATSYSRDQINWYKNAGNEAIKPPNITLGNALNISNALTSDIPPALVPNNTGGYVDTWSITPALNGTPSFNTRSGALYGTYTSGAGGSGLTSVTHRLTATNAGGSDTITVNINRPTP